jgi:hypothetical protein
MKTYYKSTEHYVRFNSESGELLNIFKNLDVVSTQQITEDQRSLMISSLSSMNTSIEESEFNAILDSAKEKINNL